MNISKLFNHILKMDVPHSSRLVEERLIMKSKKNKKQHSG
jgi:hypothetical protein